MKKLLLFLLISIYIYPSQCPEKPNRGEKLYENVNSDLISKRSELQSYLSSSCSVCNAKPHCVKYREIDEFGSEYSVYNEDYCASILVDEMGSCCFVIVNVFREFDLALFMAFMDSYFKDPFHSDLDESC